MEKKLTYYSFAPGADLVPHGEYHTFQDAVIKALGGVSLNTYYTKRRGTPFITYQQKIAIDEIFKRYNISPEQAWKIWEE